MPNPPDQFVDLLSTAEVAALFEVDTATVNRWARAGKLPVTVKGPGKTGANLYRRADVDAFRASAAA